MNTSKTVSQLSQLSELQHTENFFRFILKERWLTITVIGSIFTFAFIQSLKGDIIDPLFHFIISSENFGFMNMTIREGEKMPSFQQQIELRFGNFFRETVVWLFMMVVLFALYKFASFPDMPYGNPGFAVL